MVPPRIEEPATDLPPPGADGVDTTLAIVAVSSAGLKSACAADTDAVSTRAPVCCGRTWIVTGCVWPGPSWRTGQTTAPPGPKVAEQPAGAETPEVPAGNWIVIWTPVSVSAPALRAV